MLPSEIKDILLNDDLERLKKYRFLRSNVYGSKGKTLLHYAAKYCNEAETLKHCVNTLKINPNALTKRGKLLALHVSCISGKLCNAKFLLSYSESLLESCETFGETALGLAAKNNHTDLAVLLHQKGANLNTTNKLNWTPLHWACKNKNPNLVNYLILSGANPDCINSSGDSCLHLAVESDCIQTVNLLLPCVFPLHVSQRGTIIHYSYKNPEMTDFLLEKTIWKQFPKLSILLDIQASAHIIVKHCLNELKGQALCEIVKRDRDDLVKELYFKHIIKEDFLMLMTQAQLRPKCEKIVLSLSRWQIIKKILFVYKNEHQNNCINRLPVSLIRELISFV